MGATRLQGAPSVSETQALILARLSLEVLSLCPSTISVMREYLLCLSSPLTASSVKGDTRVDGLLGLGVGDFFSASVATSRSHCSPLEKSKVRSSCTAATFALLCSSCLARALVSFERPRVLVPATGF